MNLRNWNLTNNKSKNKWQKKFIDKVFAHKTTAHTSYSKIILNNKDLINDKTAYAPKSLFKFYTPTSDNIFDIKNKRLWLSHPANFNDPFDCHIGYNVNSYEKRALIKHIKNLGPVNTEKADNAFTVDEYNRISWSSTENLGRHLWSNVEEYSDVFMSALNHKSQDFRMEIYRFISSARKEAENKIDKLRNTDIRVACFSALDQYEDFGSIIPLWSHYTNDHTGFCVEYDLSSLNSPSECDDMDERIKLLILAGLFPVIYTARRVNIPPTKLKKINLDKASATQTNSDIDAILYKTYIVKSAKWSYEKEWRLILDGSVCNFYDKKIPFPYIKTIFLGCRMKTHIIEMMIEIASELGVEVKLMAMDAKKFILADDGLDSYLWKKEVSKWKDPFS